VRPGVLGEDRHPDQGARRVRQSDGFRPHNQDGRPAPARGPHCARNEAARQGSRGAVDTIAEDLRRDDIELELLTGPLQGIYNPSGRGAALFAFFAGMAESEREYIRDLRRTREEHPEHPHRAHCTAQPSRL
jgi:hypothetical protein